MLRFLHALVFALAAVLGIASGVHAFEAKTALRGNFGSAQDRVGAFGSQALGTRQQNPTAATTIASECSYAARGALNFVPLLTKGPGGAMLGEAMGVLKATPAAERIWMARELLGQNFEGPEGAAVDGAGGGPGAVVSGSRPGVPAHVQDLLTYARTAHAFLCNQEVLRDVISGKITSVDDLDSFSG